MARKSLCVIPEANIQREQILPSLPCQPSHQFRPVPFLTVLGQCPSCPPDLACLGTATTDFSTSCFGNIFRNLLLAQAKLRLSNLPFKAESTCEVLLITLKYIILKPAKGRRQRLIPYNLTLAQHFQLKDLHSPNPSVFCPLVVPSILWSAKIIPKVLSAL